MATERWSPFADIRRFDEMFNKIWRGETGLPETPEAWSIPLDVTRNGDEITVKASLPGVKKDDVDITLEDNVLTIRAEMAREDEHKEEGYLLRERRAGSFYRAVRLPEAVDSDKAKSTYADGVLTITLPKHEEKKAKKLSVTAA